MTDDGAIAPTLSTYQDNSTFEFSRTETEVKNRPHLGDFNKDDGDELRLKIVQYYQLDRLAEYLKQEKKNQDGESKRIYKRITFQFPDNLICDSATIVHELQDRLSITASTVYQSETQEECKKSGCDCNDGGNSSVGDEERQRIWILADTSYSSCCVDEVAAQHVNSELVVHFGDACLNPINKTKALFVLGSPMVNRDHLVESIKQRYPENEFRDQRILLMADAPHTYHLREIYPDLKKIYKFMSFADLTLNGNPNASILGQEMNTFDGIQVLNRNIVGLENLDKESDTDQMLSEYNIFHITMPEVPRLLQLTTMFHSCTIYKPQEQEVFEGPYPNLMRRYRFMNVARSAGNVGLLVNTLSLANTKTLINKISKRIKDAGKKHYTFVVGKPNVAKLANFESIDIWCVLGCDHQGIIVDQYNEYFKPVITPYELLLALNDDLTWTGKWMTSFNSILHTMDDDEDKELEGTPSDRRSDQTDPSTDDDEDEAPTFDIVTGKYVSTSKPLRQIKHLQITSNESSSTDSGALVKKLSNAVVIKNTVSTSAVHLQSRHWTGLGSDFNNDDAEENKGAKVEEGRGGIARSYDFDMEINK